MNKQKVVIGLSGGVDSSVAAALLLEGGYEVYGVYLECYNEPGCRTDQDKADALKVALKLGITFEILDFRKEYKEKVVEYFYREYEVGRTPNPDVMCNREIKFGIFYDWAIEHGFDYVATGHYCRILQGSVPCDDQLQGTEPCNWLQRARDESKDQSYFLCQIPQDHLKHILFPLGEMLKTEVREKAKELGLSTANKPDSMGICFIGEVDVNKLLKDRLGENPGEVVLIIKSQKFRSLPKTAQRSELWEQGSELCTIGTHRGLWFYTIGERKGLELDKLALKKLGMRPEKMGPMYVIGKNMEKNQLIVGSREETMKIRFRVGGCRLENMEQDKLCVRIRNLGELVPVEKILGNTVILKEKIFGIAEGQSAVFYDINGVLVGSSIIV